MAKINHTHGTVDISSHVSSVEMVETTSFGDSTRQFVPGMVTTSGNGYTTSSTGVTWVPAAGQAVTYTHAQAAEAEKKTEQKARAKNQPESTAVSTWEPTLRRDGKCLHGSSSVMWCPPCKAERAAWDAEQSTKVADEIKRVEEKKKAPPTKGEMAAELEKLRHLKPGTATEAWGKYVSEAFAKPLAYTDLRKAAEVLPRNRADQLIVSKQVYDQLIKTFGL